jgi:sugar phosphate isomerase/epimerase
MNIKYIRAAWGMEGEDLQSKLDRIKKAGFDGIELPSLHSEEDQQLLKSKIEDENLPVVGQLWTGYFSPVSVEKHIEDFREQQKRHANSGVKILNCHTGKDHFSLDDNLKIIDEIERLSKEEGMSLHHEIHRGRSTFSTLAWKSLVEQRPELRFTADFSHWCCVHESFLQDQKEVVDLAISKCDYIHARVGHTQGSQIPDPRAPEWKEAVDIHLAWWDAIVEQHREKGADELWVCPEFGPYPYMPHLPLGNVPVTNLWDVNLYMKDMLKERYD